MKGLRRFLFLMTATVLAGHARAALIPQDFSQVDFTSNESSVEFLAKGNPGGIRIHGVGKGPSGVISVEKQSASGTLSLDLSTLDTGIKLRTDHMKLRYLEIEKFPLATLTFEGFKLSMDPLSSKETSEFPFKGKLSLHGVTKEVTGVAKLKPGASTAALEASFRVTPSEFAIAQPTFLGIKVADEVEVTVHADRLVILARKKE